MKTINIFLSLALILISFYLSTQPIHALIFIPAVVLIPIAKIVALVIGGFTIPSLGTAVIWHKATRTPLRKTIAITLISLLIIAILLAITLKLFNPDRPLF